MRHILSGNIATRVPSVREAPTELPEPAVASAVVPASVVVPTELPFWIRRIVGVVAAEAEILMSAAMALPAGVRELGARGAISAAVQTITIGAGQRALAGRAQLSVVAGYPAMSPTVTTYETAGSFSYALPYWWRYLDIILLGGGASGQAGNGANGQAGAGGAPSAWVTVTVKRGVDVPAMTTTLDVVVGAGGAQAAPGAPNPGGASSVAVPGGASVRAPGGSGTISGQNGGAPGNVSYQTITRTGGAAGTGSGGAATAPGASGAGGNGGTFGNYAQGGAGARGEVVIRARQ